MKKDELKDLLAYECSCAEGYISLAEYAKKMPESQKYIYYAAAGDAGLAAKLPQAEQVLDAGFSVLYMTQDVDEFVVQILGEYEGKKFCNVSCDDLGLETESQKADTDKKEEESRELLDFVKQQLGGEVENVKLSHKLKSHPVCLSTEGEITLEVEKYFNSLPMTQGEPVKAKKILELNGGHKAFEALEKAYESDREKAAVMAKVLYAQARLIAGLPLEDPAEYAEMVCKLF